MVTFEVQMQSPWITSPASTQSGATLTVVGAVYENTD